MEPFQTAASRAEIHRAWCMQLYREYDNILHAYRLPLQPATVCIEALQSVWGRWDPQLRTITLSTALIEQHPWDVVIEVFKHEIAHQIVSDVYRSIEHHGKKFVRACQMVGVADWAARASGDLPRHIASWKDRAVSPDEERLLKKVDKLLSLATSSNEHEANLAMQRVREITARHNLAGLQHGQTPDMVHLDLGGKKKRIDQVEAFICAILVEHFFVRCIYTHRYDAVDLCSYRAIEILGTRQNVLMAEYVHAFLLGQVQRLWAAFRLQAPNKGVRAKRSYMLGVLLGFGDKLKSSKPAAQAGLDDALGAAQAHALVRLGEQALDAHVAARHPRLTTHRTGSRTADAGVFTAGKRDGEQIVLHKGLGTAATQRGRLLHD